MNIGDTIKSVTRGMPAMITGGKPGYRAGDDKLAWARTDLTSDPSLTLRSPSFEEGGVILAKHSVDGEDVSPPLQWAGAVEAALSFALVVEDPDAPTPNPFVHWLLYNIPSEIRELPQGLRDPLPGLLKEAAQGKNSNLKTGWTGMAPPKGDTPHRYFFQLFALDRRLPLEPGAGRAALFEAMAGHVVARGRIVGTYQR